MTDRSGSSRIDLGRIVMVPLGVIMLLVNVRQLNSALSAHPTLLSASRSLGALLTMAFYLLIVVAYLRRTRATATSQSWLAGLAAMVATALPFSFPLLTSTHGSFSAVAVSDVLLVAGLTWSVWSVRTLGRSLSIFAQVRTLVHTGPYRLVRHPLYLGELVAALGIVLHGSTGRALLAWVVLSALQVYRASQEERLLSDHIPGYEAYRARTTLVIPGVV